MVKSGFVTGPHECIELDDLKRISLQVQGDFIMKLEEIMIRMIDVGFSMCYAFITFVSGRKILSRFFVISSFPILSVACLQKLLML